jgi:hypothetical protein
MRSPLVLAALLLPGCRAALPPAAPAPGHGLERVWIETLGLE